MRYLKKLIIYLVIGLTLSSCASSRQHPLSGKVDKFLLIKRDVLFNACNGDLCVPGTGTAFGSGFIIGTNGTDSIGVTAGHVCEDFHVPPGVKVMSADVKVKSIDGRAHSAEVLKVDFENDLCLLKIKGFISHGLSVARSAPAVGDPSYAMASPLAMFSPDMVPLFSGYFSGEVSTRKDGYAMPAQGGSSGAPIVNSDGQVIGVIVAKLRGLENFCVSPPHASVRDFILGAQRDLRRGKL